MPTLTNTHVPLPSTTTPLSPIPTETAKEYPLTSLENFQDSVITMEDLPDYFNWLKNVVGPTLAPIFQERYNNGTMQTDVPLSYHSYGETSYIAFKNSASFADENTAPFMRHTTFAYMPAEWITDEMREYGATATGYLVSTTFMYEVTNAATGEGIAHPIIQLVIGSFDQPETRRGAFQSYSDLHEPRFIVEPRYPSGHEDPWVKKIFNIFNRSGRDMESRTKDFMSGDWGAFSEPGLALLTTLGKTTAGWFQD